MVLIRVMVGSKTLFERSFWLSWADVVRKVETCAEVGTYMY